MKNSIKFHVFFNQNWAKSLESLSDKVSSDIITGTSVDIVDEILTYIKQDIIILYRNRLKIDNNSQKSS